MIVVFNVKVTSSAEIVVTAGSSTDDRVVITNYLGRTIGSALQEITRKGYRLKFVTDTFFVCTKNTPVWHAGVRKTNHHPTIFSPQVTC